MDKFFTKHRSNPPPSSSSPSSSPPSSTISSNSAASPPDSPDQGHQDQSQRSPAKAESSSLGGRKTRGGIVLDKDGKPCRTCNTFASFLSATGKPLPPPSSSSHSHSPDDAHSPTHSPAYDPYPHSTSPPHPPCPPDVSQLGSHTWTLLHSIGATYPERASAAQQRDMRQFLKLLAGIYPCGTCGEEFGAWMGKEGNRVRVEGREGLGGWLCEAHNEVNRRLGKREFDCARWEERWRTGGEGC